MQSYGSQNLLNDDVAESKGDNEAQGGSKQNTNIDFEESEQEEFEAQVTLLQTRTKKLIVPFFILVAMASLLFSILGLTQVWDDYASIIFMLLISGSAALLGAYGIYKWGTVMMEIDRLSGENRKYEGEIGLLQTNLSHLKQNISSLNENVSVLKTETNDLNKSMNQFDELRKDLKAVAGQNEDILNMVNDMNKVYGEMSKIIIENEKSALFEIYYEVELRDKSHGLSKREWDRFMGRLSEEQRRRFHVYGTFEDIAGNDNVIDFMEFQQLIQKCLDSYSEEIIRRESRKMSKHKN